MRSTFEEARARGINGCLAEGDLLLLLEYILNLEELILRDYQNMSQAQFQASISSTAANPVVITPTSGSAAFSVGQAQSFTLGAISGGVPPYSPSVDASSPNPLPAGLTLGVDSNNNLNVAGTTQTAFAAESVTIDVNDSTSGQAQSQAEIASNAAAVSAAKLGTTTSGVSPAAAAQLGTTISGVSPAAVKAAQQQKLADAAQAATKKY
jgi:hypothetical protein